MAKGQPPFINFKDIRMDGLVPEIMPYLLLQDSNTAVPLSPMIFWWQDPKAPIFDHGCCYMFDSPTKDGSGFSFKTVGRNDQLTVLPDHDELGSLVKLVKAEREQDGPIETVPVTIVLPEERMVTLPEST